MGIVQTNGVQDLYAPDLALINTIGAWHEKNEADLAVISKITNQSSSIWVQKAREILNLPDSPFILKNVRLLLKHSAKSVQKLLENCS